LSRISNYAVLPRSAFTSSEVSQEPTGYGKCPRLRQEARTGFSRSGVPGFYPSSGGTHWSRIQFVLTFHYRFKILECIGEAARLALAGRDVSRSPRGIPSLSKPFRSRRGSADSRNPLSIFDAWPLIPSIQGRPQKATYRSLGSATVAFYEIANVALVMVSYAL
jgi:hypothetical protein